MPDPMKIRATTVGDETEVKVLMSHEMETGQRKDGQGKTIPAWFIQNVSVTWNSKTVLSAQWGTAVAKNPFVSFRFKGGAKGDKITVTWVDNRAEKRTDESMIA
ncbi:MAG: thiosulfate oxidation carrier complex protein SoxZ [Betaproteobacteria bacterium]|nr:MAG: thiosulfate oxidation carrier complex protein SoxZ [Betaproteobacteria bacterium]